MRCGLTRFRVSGARHPLSIGHIQTCRNRRPRGEESDAAQVGPKWAVRRDRPVGARRIWLSVSPVDHNESPENFFALPRARLGPGAHASRPVLKTKRHAICASGPRRGRTSYFHPLGAGQVSFLMPVLARPMRLVYPPSADALRVFRSINPNDTTRKSISS